MFRGRLKPLLDECLPCSQQLNEKVSCPESRLGLPRRVASLLVHHHETQQRRRC